MEIEPPVDNEEQLMGSVSASQQTVVEPVAGSVQQSESNKPVKDVQQVTSSASGKVSVSEMLAAAVQIS